MRNANFYHKNLKPDNDIYEGQSIERMVEQAETSKQPIQATSPTLYTPRKDGVRAETNIRTDRWDLALKAMDKVTGSYRATRQEFIKSQKENKDTTTTTAQA